MRRDGWWKALGLTVGMTWGAAVLAPAALAHCDGLDGPVVTAARRALEKNDVTSALVWVREVDEAEIRQAFRRAQSVRKLNPQARELADTYFFETLVRIHRAGEGAPYTGLQPAGRDLGPAIPAADRALVDGDVEPLVKLLVGAMEEGVRSRFAETRAARSYPAGNVQAGRIYVERYVPFIHYVERLYQSAATSPSGHEEVGLSVPHQH